MAHYAFLDENNVVTEVIAGIDETELIEGLDTETWYGNFRGQVCKRTSYWTFGNVHYGDDGSPAFRKNYAGIGYGFDGIGFFAPQPYPSWILNPETYYWEAPVPYPNDGKDYVWDEATQSWVEIPTP
jgi:hypothetical protein